MLRQLSIFLYLLCSFSVIFAQKSVLSGKITDISTGETLPAVHIKVGQNVGSSSDAEGNYMLNLEAGDYSLQFSYVGYQTFHQNVSLKKGEIVTLNIALEAQENILNTVTVTGGKFEKPLGEVTVSLEVLKPSLIASNNTQSVDQVLEKVPGVSIIGDQANIRGGSGFSYGAGSRVLLLVDDIPALQADAGRPNWDDLPVENIEQIEVVKGAASTFYGSSAMNGVINIRTSYPKAKPETKAAIYYTAFDSPKDASKKWWTSSNAPYSTGINFSHKQQMTKKFDLVLSGNGHRSDNYNKDTYDQYGRINVGTRYRITDRFSVGFNSSFNFNKNSSFFYWKNYPTSALQGDPGTFLTGKNTRYWIDPFATYFDKSGNRHKFLGRFHYIHSNSLNGQQDNSNSSKLYYGEYQFQRVFQSSNLVFSAGAVLIGSSVTAKLYGDTVYTTRNLSGYFQVDKKFFDKLSVSAGMRWEQNFIKSPEKVGGIAVPNGGESKEAKPVFRLGLNYQVDKFTFLRASWGQAYRFPTIAEKFITTQLNGVPVAPNPSLRSETGWSGEVGIKKGIKIKDWLGFVDVSGFWSEYQDMMEFTLVRMLPFRFESRNVGNTIIRGAECSIGGQGEMFGLTTNILAGYLYIDPRYKNFNAERDTLDSSVGYNILKYRFRHSFKIDWESRYRKFSAAFSINHSSNMEAIDRIFEEVIPGLKAYRRENNSGFTIVDLRFAYLWSKHLKTSILIKNLLNKEYAVRPALLEAPRNLTLRVEYNF